MFLFELLNIILTFLPAVNTALPNFVELQFFPCFSLAFKDCRLYNISKIGTVGPQYGEPLCKGETPWIRS